MVSRKTRKVTKDVKKVTEKRMPIIRNRILKHNPFEYLGIRKHNPFEYLGPEIVTVIGGHRDQPTDTSTGILLADALQSPYEASMASL